MKIKYLSLRCIAVLVVLAGILSSFYFGRILKEDAIQSWLIEAAGTAEKATTTCQSWFALQQTQLRGIAAIFFNSKPVSENRFLDVLDLIEVPASLPFHAVAYAERQPTDSGEQYIVTLSSDPDSILAPDSDLGRYPQILSALAVGHLFPGEVVISPTFLNDQGALMTCLLITLYEQGKSGLVIATINLQDQIEDLATLHIPAGLHLQTITMTTLADGSPWKTDFYHSNISPILPTRSFHIRADAGKVTLDYLWGVTPDFSGGPDIKLGSLVQITGVLFSLLLFAVLWFLFKENTRVQKKIEIRTAELSAAVEDINNEIKEKIQAEQALKASSERLKALSDASFEAIFLSDKGICVDLNNTAAKMFGYSREEAIGAAATIIFAPDQLEIVLKNIQSEKEVPYEAIATRKDGTTFPVHIQGRTIEYFGRRVRVSAITDITDRKNAEQDKEKLTEQLHQAKKMESIGLMAGGVAHDLNNILSGIIGYPELLLQALPAGSKLRKPLEAIRESGQRAATVVADLLTVARGAATSKAIHNLNELVREYFESPECAQLNSLYPEVTCRRQCTAKQPALCCSAVHIKKCLMNLVLNGVEAIPEHGTVVVSTSNTHIDETDAGEHDMEPGEYVVLRVQDTGPGIADSDLQHIFEPFYTRKEMGRSGTGLGLTVVWNTMEDHGGKVSVQSSPQGTCFTLYFPLSTEQKALPTQHDRGEYCHKNEHILIVDDEPQLRDIAAQMLQSSGYQIDTVASGELAVDFVRKTPVDLLIIDMMMGSGMNGRKTYEKILAMYPGQQAIVASGFSESEDVKATLKLGAGGFIKKPYSMEQLNKMVHEVLRHEPENS